MATVAQVNRMYAEIKKELRDTTSVEHDIGLEIRRQAQRNATQRPTPQARGVAGSLRVGKSGTVFGLPSSLITLSGRQLRAAGVNFGAEYGSDHFKQFAPRRASGYWLNPAGEQADSVSIGEKWLDRLVEDAARGIT